MKRLLILSFIFSFIICYSVQGSAYNRLDDIVSAAFEGVEVTPKILEQPGNNRETAINGIVPSVMGSTSLGNKIEKVISEEIGAANAENVASLTFGYKIAVSDEYETASFIISSAKGDRQTQDNVSTVVINTSTLNTVKASDLLGGCGLKLATSVVNNYISANFKNMPRLSSLEENVDFYITDEAVYFLFDKYEIAPGSEGIQSVPMYFSKLTRFTLEKEEYYSNQEKYNVKMLPLRHAIRNFGYNLKWNSESQEITIVKNSRGRNESIAKIKINENSYIRAGELTPETLEAPPEIRNGLTYVPITFMETILNISYSVENDGTIELARYDY